MKFLTGGAFWVALLAAALAARGAEDAYSASVRVVPLLQTKQDGGGQPLVYPAGGAAEVTAVLVEVPPGAQTNWHKHPVPCFAYILAGELEVEFADGSVKTVKSGEAVAETINVLHNGVNRGASPARLVMFALGVAGEAYAVRVPKIAPEKK